MLEQIVPDFNIEYCSDIKQAIDLYNAHLYIKDGKYFPDWDEAFINQCKTVDTKIKALLGRYCSTIKDDNFRDIYSSVELCDFEDFWRLLASFVDLNKLQWKTIESCVCDNAFAVQRMLYCPKYAHEYDIEMADYLCRNPMMSAIFLIDKYINSHIGVEKEVILPKSLDVSRKEQIIADYLNGDNQNPNYLEMISQWRSTGDFSISDKLRLKAKRLHSKYISNMFSASSDSGFKFSVSVCFCDLDDKLGTIRKNGSDIEYRYNKRFIKDNLEPFMILRNFSQLFGYVDTQGRALLVSKPGQLSVFERYLGAKSITDYPKGIAFILREMTSQVQLAAYEKELKKNNVSLENALEWFFIERLPQSYGVQGISISLPTDGSYLIKCRNLFPEIEKVLKAYKQFVEDGSVDLELLQFASTPLIYGSVPSLLEKKYAYGLGEDFKRAASLVASDQCMLSYIPRIEERYSNLFELISNEKISIADYQKYQISDIHWLVDQGLIIEDQGILRPAGKMMQVLHDFYNNEVIDYYHISPEARTAVDAFDSMGWIKFESSLFSIPEQNFISFNLDRNKYGNGYDIRNRYVHGSFSSEVSEEEHKKNYYIGLSILVLAILKIDAELEVCMQLFNKNRV